MTLATLLATICALAWGGSDLDARVRDAEPQLTRAGFPRFTDPLLADPAATPAIVARLTAATDDAPTRAALVEAAMRSGGAWSAPLVDWLAREPDALVRATIVGALPKADDPAAARRGILAGAADADAEVRAAAFRAIGGRTDSSDLVEVVLAGLADEAGAVRAAAARAAGWRGLPEAWPALVERLSDDDPEVRVQALRALERLDAGRAGDLGPVRALLADPDPRVAQTARLLVP